eukprot:gnl/TRDRNA2_/TRDRNA2_91838_c0_seq1.p1 gnl/TRDRNA2_/TRDRNA2_91838_c0~~gnl/TRDRNA2_/TRDRNA2_91838_c0_seq1.p1  ORF type:complete len:555 (+),score=155.19 gnl/TRDRNA2_/TRDRNA2_91838_c0_seq1:64-1728(+)
MLSAKFRKAGAQVQVGNALSRNRTAPAQGLPSQRHNDFAENEFLLQVQSNDSFLHTLGSLSSLCGIKVIELNSFAEELCRCCWKQALLLGNCDSDKHLAAAKREVEKLKQKLVDCNLSAMKQMSIDRGGTHSTGELGMDTITMHEPFNHLDDSTKELVLQICRDKLRQLSEGTAPSSLIEKLSKNQQGGGGDQAGTADEATLKELEETREQLKQLQLRLDEEVERADKAEAALVTAGERAEKAEKALAELTAAYEELQELAATQQQELESAKAELDVLRNSIAELQARYDTLEEEANEMREELARRNNTRTHSTQTSLTGEKIEAKDAEIKKLKVMLEELQMKVRELMNECMKKGIGKEVAHIAEDLGISEIVKAKSVFQRLYDDAIHRVARLENLREKVKNERARLFYKPGVEAESDDENDVPDLRKELIDVVGKSDLGGQLGSLTSAREEDPASPSSQMRAGRAMVPPGGSPGYPASNCRVHIQELGHVHHADTALAVGRRLRKLGTSASAPVLPAVPQKSDHAQSPQKEPSVIQMDLDGGKKRVKRKLVLS